MSKNNTLHVLLNVVFTSNNLLSIGQELMAYPVLATVISTKGFCNLEVFEGGGGGSPRLLGSDRQHSFKIDVINNNGERVQCEEITAVLKIN